jgi:hypothetical protein
VPELREVTVKKKGKTVTVTKSFAKETSKNNCYNFFGRGWTV